MGWCSIDADLALVGYTKEVSAGAFLDPTAQVHILDGSHEDGHQPIIRSPHPGSRQRVALDAAVAGMLDPALSLTFPFRYDDAEIQLEALLGGASVAGAWSIGAALPSYSVSIADGVTWWKYAGCMVDSAQLTSSFGNPTTLALSMKALTQVEDTQANYDLLALTTAPANRYYILEDCAIVSGATSSPATVIEPQSVTLNIANGLITTRAPGQRGPACHSPGSLIIGGTLSFPLSGSRMSDLRSFVSGYSLHYLQLAWTVNAKVVTLKLPVKFVAPAKTLPEGSTPQTADLAFEAFGSDFSYTNPAIAATSTAY